MPRRAPSPARSLVALSAVQLPIPTTRAWARLWALAIVHHERRSNAEADAALSELVARYADGAACNIAQVYGARGDIDLALEWLERAYAQRDAGLSEIKSQPFLRSLHSDSRWVAFLTKMGLAD